MNNTKLFDDEKSTENRIKSLYCASFDHSDDHVRCAIDELSEISKTSTEHGAKLIIIEEF